MVVKYRKILPMKINNTHSWLLAILSVFSLTACTINMNVDWQDKPVYTLDQETADLADVTTDVLALLEQTDNDRILMVFDIDNTLLAMEQGLGADQWYEWQKDLADNDRCNTQNVGNRFAVQGAIYFASAMRPTQGDAARQVKSYAGKRRPGDRPDLARTGLPLADIP